MYARREGCTEFRYRSVEVSGHLRQKTLNVFRRPYIKNKEPGWHQTCLVFFSALTTNPEAKALETRKQGGLSSKSLKKKVFNLEFYTRPNYQSDVRNEQTFPDMHVFKKVTSRTCFLRKLLQDVVWQKERVTKDKKT